MAGKSELTNEVIEYSVLPNVHVRWILQEMEAVPPENRLFFISVSLLMMCPDEDIL